MQFELTKALIGDILFSMEDQEGEFYLDAAEAMVVGGPDFPEETGEEGDDGNGSRFIPLPEWDSASGFRLMERFAAGFRNPLVREELSASLGRGKGVFRAFKNTLGRYPEAEKLWFAFKEREMKREILKWYNGLREEWGLEKIGGEPEDTGDLVLLDFRFRPFTKEDAEAAGELHRLVLEEYSSLLAESGAGEAAGILAGETRAPGKASAAPEETPSPQAMTAESGEGEFAGYISGAVHDANLYIEKLEVRPEFRGLGVGEALLVRFMESFGPGEVCRALIDLPALSEGFSRVLLRESFKPYTTRYWLDLRSRAD